MITYVDFSLFDSPAKVIVNTVNTVGVMGKGIAKEFKRIYPEMFSEYQKLCEHGMFSIGELWLYKTPHKWILNFPTKRHWRYPSKPEYIEAGLTKFTQFYQDARITSVSFPQLGCGNGELDWKTQVRPLMERHLKSLPLEVFIHVVPTRASERQPEHRVPRETEKWLRSEPTSLAFSEMWSDLMQVVRTKCDFETVDGKEVFTAHVFDDEKGDGLRVAGSGDPVLLYREQFIDLWQQIRDMGICIPQIMPSGLDLQPGYVLPLLAELPYLELVRQSRAASRLSKNAVGLLLRPPAMEIHHSTEEPRQLNLV